ncbi:MAG: DUF1049 domain-containing protein [Phycisphaeraceae bacterium]|nr:DUF1049 domain-containing protein [Phycisphaeraceae bacterium]
MNRVKVVLLLLVILLLLVAVAQNTAPVPARFLWMTAEISGVVLLFLTAAAGFAAGLLVALIVRGGPKKPKG